MDINHIKFERKQKRTILSLVLSQNEGVKQIICRRRKTQRIIAAQKLA